MTFKHPCSLVLLILGINNSFSISIVNHLLVKARGRLTIRKRWNGEDEEEVNNLIDVFVLIIDAYPLATDFSDAAKPQTAKRRPV